MKRLGNRYWIIAGLVLFFIVTIFINVWIRKEGFTQQEKNYMDGVDVIYWINLDRSPERRENTEKVLADPVFQDIPKIRISATDGKKPDEMYKKLGDYNKQEKITDYEYGCLLSHLDSIKEFSKSRFETAIIFEDDVTLEFQPFWRKSMREVANEAPKDWEIIMLWYNVDTNGFNNEDYVKFNGQFYTLAYLINKRGAKRLMEMSNGQGKYKLVDDYHHKADYYLYSVLNTYVYKYPYFIYKTDNDSEIHKDHVAIFHNKNKKNAETFYEREKNIEPMTGNTKNSSNVIGYIHVCQKEG